ncbi:MAG: WYL domain-containing protein [Actinobacteria bacterium]|uniref:Unannotated protein n=1 Tax=freshwater metagenome TaxID=449393 RepID=A0A6J6GCE2_9ZZZZ|nr:WYL domain-containing protein [Actinomycetota bacterium]
MNIRIDKPVPAEERTYCLLLALISEPYGLSKAMIYKSVRGYREDFLSSGVTDALEKKFERDKRELRSMGIPLMTSNHENPADQVYSISESDYEQLSFTDAEISLLTAASAVWSESALSSDARELKIRLLANDVATVAHLEAHAPRIETRDASYPSIANALESNSRIAFNYLKPGQFKPEKRVVSPLALVNYDGRWHLLAHDYERDAERTFLLRRIVGEVQDVRVKESDPPAVDPRPRAGNELIVHLNELWRSLTATVRVAPQTKAAVSLANRKDTVVDGDVYTVHYLDEAVFADELCEYGVEAIVLEPQSLRDAVISRLERLADDHG